MRRFIRALALVGPISMTACAIHPLPEDVTGVPTYTIVRQIRCETRQAIIDSAIGWLTTEGEDRVDPASRAIGFQFANGRPFSEFGASLFKGQVKSIVQLFSATGVAYNFDLEMTEVNNADTEINLLKPFTNATFTLGIKAGLDRSRKNERTFTITDTFGGLAKLPESYCDGRPVHEDYNYNVQENYLYPISGKIGAKHLVQDFVNLTLFANLGKKDDPKGPPTLVDALEFQTVISGSLAPKVVFVPTGTGLSVTDASLSGAVSRTDLHKITMGLAIAGAGVQLVAPVRTALFTTSLVSTRAAATGSEARAAEAVNQAITLNLFRQNITIVP